MLIRTGKKIHGSNKTEASNLVGVYIGKGLSEDIEEREEERLECLMTLKEEDVADKWRRTGKNGAHVQLILVIR